MNRSVQRRYVRKMEALDTVSGLYPSRQHTRMRYNQNDFLEYLDALTDEQWGYDDADTA